MNPISRIERTLSEAIETIEAPGGPPGLAAAMRHAVFPSGARIRPRLCLAVAAACGDDSPAISAGAGAAIELLHCASLVHDDLPCFDDAATRRGRPSIHAAFGEQVAVLAGDALIVLAFQTIAVSAVSEPGRLRRLIAVIARSAGMPFGIAAGQAWESEPRVNLAAYQQAKTGALFAAATVAGAVAAGAEGERWRGVGECIGEAYQVADDIRDAVGTEQELGKPVGQDILHQRPSAVREHGIAGAVQRLRNLAADAVQQIPPCPGEAELRSLILSESKRLLPMSVAQQAA